MNIYPLTIACVTASLLAPLLSAQAAAARGAQGAKRPNIVFVFSDDHATHAIGAYGGRYEALDPTPQIDRLAKDGMLFRRSFCTNSICGPSRAVILTGKHSHANGFMRNGQKFDGDQQTFPKLLQKAGYRTAMIGKWHLSSSPQGFDYYDVLRGQGAYYNPILLRKDGKRTVNGYCTDVVTELAIEWLEKHVGDESTSKQPFMLMCQHKAPHRTWMPAPRHLTLYDDVEIPEPETLFDRFEDNASPALGHEMGIDEHMNLVYDLFLEPWPGWDPNAGKAHDRSGFRNLERMSKAQLATWWAAYRPKNAAFRKAKLSGRELVRWKYRRYIKNYLRCVRGVDDSVGRLRKWLQERGLADNTVFVYSSDQGFYLGDHGWYDKRWMYEESLEMPLIVSWPGVTKRGSTSDALVQNLDYAETFLEIAGAKVPADMQGRSLVPLLRGENPEPAWRDAIYYHYYAFPSVHMVAKHYGIRTKRYKLIRFYEFGEWELYDLAKDPDERRNVYADPEYRDVAMRLAERLGELRREYRDESDASEKPDEWKAKYRRKRR